MMTAPRKSCGRISIAFTIPPPRSVDEMWVLDKTLRKGAEKDSPDGPLFTHLV
jgi:hypothetical protein